MIKRFVFISIVVSSCFISLSVFAEDHRVGWLEQVVLEVGPEKPFVIAAKIDSGADNSSLHATAIKYKEIEGKMFVQFSTVQNLTMTRPLYKTTEVKMKNGKKQKRAVVLVKLCLGGVVKEVQMNLVNRAHFSKPLLVGRSALKGFLIDVSQTQITDVTRCQGRF